MDQTTSPLPVLTNPSSGDYLASSEFQQTLTDAYNNKQLTDMGYNYGQQQGQNHTLIIAAVAFAFLIVVFELRR